MTRTPAVRITLDATPALASLGELAVHVGNSPLELFDAIVLAPERFFVVGMRDEGQSAAGTGGTVLLKPSDLLLELLAALRAGDVHDELVGKVLHYQPLSDDGSEGEASQ